MGGKSHKSEQRLKRGRERETYGTYSTPYEMCDGCLSCHRVSGTCLTFLFGLETLFALTWHERSWLHACNVLYVAHTLASCQLSSERSLAACNSRVICTQGGCCGSWSMVRLFVK